MAVEHTSNFDELNGIEGYELIAPEYYDAFAHPTCNNFFCLSRQYIFSELEIRPESHILEVGAGDSAAAAALHSFGRPVTKLEITDGSDAMLRYSTRWLGMGARLRNANATALPYRACSFDCVVASLADPYNTEEFWTSLTRILVAGGCAIVTLPSFDWAAAFRRNNGDGALHSAEFALRNGRRLRVPSLTRDLKEQIEMIDRVGLSTIHFRSLGAAQLVGESISPKARVFENHYSSLVWGFTAVKGRAYP